MLIGEYRHNIDAKGRLFIPAKFREMIGEKFIFSRGLDKCVCIYPVEEWERFTEKLESLSFARDRHIRRFFFSGASEGTIDSQGRVTLTQLYREFASMEKEVVIVGNNTHIELWSAAEWDGTQENIGNEDIAQKMEMIGF